MVSNIGKFGEEQACVYLQKHGYKILATNFRSKIGEVDIIAKKHNTTIFIEVKTRTSNLFGSPAEAIGRKKLHGLIVTAEYFLSTHNLSQDFRIDAIEVFMNQGIPTFNHIKNISF